MMLVQRRVIMSWRRVGKALQYLLAHSLLFAFTLLLSLKLQHSVSYSWGVIFTPLWLFHAVVARGRFSLPAPSLPNDRHWAPTHAILATPLLVAFEILLCVHLQSSYVINLKLVFLPLLAFEMAILIDNIRYFSVLFMAEENNYLLELATYITQACEGLAQYLVFLPVHGRVVVLGIARSSCLIDTFLDHKIGSNC